MASTSAIPLNITIEFGGGTEFLTSTKTIKKHVLQVPSLVADVSSTASGISDDLATTISPPASTTVAATNGNSSSAVHPATMRDLVQIVLEKLITERHSMLIEPDGSIRPGIMVLINDADWELEGEMEYELQDGDQVCFISTLHGG